MTQKIIIDTDPGVDDAFAILLAFKSPEVNVLGLTTVFGNVALDTTSLNGLILADMAPYKVPVFKGESQPMEFSTDSYAEFVHGDDGFGNINWPASNSKLEDQHAVDWMIETIKANPNEVTLVALGPLTNLGRLVERAPEVIPLVKEVVIMGGTVHCTGNVSPVAEANIHNDPHAAELVFAASWNVVMLGLDVTSQMILTPEMTARIGANGSKQGELLAKASKFYIDFYYDSIGIRGCYLHDPSTIVYLTHPELFKTETGSIISITEGFAIGQTTFSPEGRKFKMLDWEGRSQHKVCMQVEGEKVLQLVEERLSTYA
ncbi:nucleoside hydrolase [Alteromonadaceae bacterium M269]|nr:nucleoside hydrolase [Alteromonadaceae bacterium M269]